MKFLLWFLLLFAAAVTLALAAGHPGHVLLEYPPYRVELSFTRFVLAALAVFILGHLLLRGLSHVLQLPDYLRRFCAGRAQEKGRTAMQEALTAYFEGRYAAAEKAAQRAIELGEQPALNAVLAARSAHALRDFSQRDAYLARPLGKTAGEDTMRLLAKAEFELEQQQPQAALAELQALDERGARKQPGAMLLELSAQQQLHNWDAVLDLADRLAQHKAIPPDTVQPLRRQAWQEKLRASAKDGQALRRVWKAMPDEWRLTAGIAAEAARSFMRTGECALARQVLTQA